MNYSKILRILALTLLLTACSDNRHLEVAVESTETIAHYAQFRDPQQSRVVIFVFEEETTAAQIKAHAQSLAHADGRLLAVYYFPEGDIDLAPARLSRSGHIVRANELMYEGEDISPWHYAFLRPFAGESRFTNCLETPEDVLCRKK